MAAVEMKLPESRVVRFIGDLHLGDGGRNDGFGSNDRLLSEYLADAEGACDAVVFMGDAFDLPQAWSIRRIARAHPAAMRAIAALAKGRAEVIFVRGNHDWDVAYERVFPGAKRCEELMVGEALVCHGHRFDRYCHPDARLHRHKVAAHNLAERLFGFEFRVPLAAHNTWQNRAGHWLGHKYARYLRRRSETWSERGKPERGESGEEFIRYWSRAVWGDPHAMFEPAVALVRERHYRALICGHTHLAGVVDLGGGAHYVNAGSWAFGAAQAATWDHGRLCVEDRVNGTEITDEKYRWMIAGRDPGDFFVWWKLHYRGWLRFDETDPMREPAISPG